MFLHIYRRDFLSPYGLDSTSRVAVMFVFCKLYHQGTQLDIALFCIYLRLIKVMDAQNYSVDLWGTWNPGWEPLA